MSPRYPLKQDSLDSKAPVHCLNAVRQAQFAPDGKTLVTASGDKTARLWPCIVCRPVNEIAVQLQNTIGRELTSEERFRFGVPKSLLDMKR